jgi:hypothetical protein
MDSDDAIISKVYTYLMRSNWPTKLLIFEEMYIQYFIYKDKYDGLEWRVFIVSDADKSIDYLKYTEPLSIAIITYASIAVIYALFCVYAIHRYRHFVTLKLLQINLIYLTIIGAIVCETYCISLLGRHDRFSCTVRPFLLSIGSSLYLGPLVVKSAVIYFQFTHSMISIKHQDKPKMLAVIVLVIISVTITTCLLYIGKDRTNVTKTTIKNSNGNDVESKVCSYHGMVNLNYTLGQAVYFGILSLIGLFFSYFNQNLPNTVSGGRVLFGAIFGSTATLVLTVAAIFLVNDVRYYLLTLSFGITTAVMISLSLIFFPTFHKMYSVGDKTASKTIIARVVAGMTPMKPVANHVSYILGISNILLGMSKGIL